MKIQFIVTRKLNKNYKWLTALTNEITEENLQAVLEDYDESERNEYKESILDVVFKANQELITKLKEENQMFSKETLKIFYPDLDEREQRAEEKVKREIATSLLGILDEKTISEKTKLPLSTIQQLKNVN